MLVFYNKVLDAAAAIFFLGQNFALIFCGTIIFTWFATKIPAIASVLTGGSAQVSGVSMRMATMAAIAKATPSVVGQAVSAPYRMVSRLLGGNRIYPK